MKDLFGKFKQYGVEQIFFVAATIFSSGVHFLYSIYVKAFVSPLEYGIYSTCLLLQTYMSYLQFGSLNAFNRDYPQLIGANKNEEAEKYRNTVFSFIICVYSISAIAVCGFIIAISHIKNIEERYVIGLLLIAIITVITTVENYGNYRCRIDKGFKYPSIVTIIELLSIPISLALIRKIGYYAIFINTIIAMLIGIFLYYKTSFCDFKFCIDKNLIFKIIKSGMPLLISGLVWTIINSIDKFVILGYINTEALGMYGIAQNAFTYMILIPTAMSQIFYAKMGKEYGASAKIRILTETALRFSTALSAVTSIIALIAYYFLPILVDRFMPSYSYGITAAQILIIGLSVYAATLVSGNILTILRQNAALLRSSFYMCVFNLICSIAYVYIIGAQIESVALGTATSYMFYSFITIYQVHKYAGCGIGKQIRASVLPVMISLVPGVAIYRLIENRIFGFLFSILFTILFYGICYRRQIMKVIGKES